MLSSRAHDLHQRTLWFSRAIESYPFGKAPFVLLLVAVSSTFLWLLLQGQREARPDLVLVTFHAPHQAAYRKALPEFERKYGVKVDVQLAHWSSLQARLQNAMLADTDVPDMVELLEGSLGFFARGPAKDLGLVDLTERIEAEQLRQRMVESRFSLWSARGRILGLPHDVHPTMLAYRRDLVEQLGIDVRQLDTWEQFAAVGRQITKDLDGDGVIDRYMIDLPSGGAWGLSMLMLERGIQLFDEQGEPAFANQRTAEVFLFYIELTQGDNRIAYDCGMAQPFFKAMADGLALFYLTPDWRSFTYQAELPSLKGKMALMALPAWEKGARRTSVWGGTGLVITRRSRHRDLAWELAKHLYLNQRDLGQRFKDTNVIPPLKQAWDLEEFNQPNPFFSGQRVGKLYAALAPETPPVNSSPVIVLAHAEVNGAFSRAVEHYKAYGRVDLMPAIRRELDLAAEKVRKMAERNQVLSRGE